MQSQAIVQMMHGQVYQAPLQEPRRIVDVGCGTGIATRHFADRFPTAEVIGVDLSAVPEQKTRARFMQGNIRTLAADPTQMKPEFDYVFSRMLVYGMTDWPGYIAQAKNLLNQGGWIELQDLDTTTWYDEQDRVVSASWRFPKEMGAAMSKVGLDTSVPPKLEGYLREAGFVDVHAKVFRWMFGPRQGHPETDFIAAYSQKYLVEANFMAYQKIFAASHSAEQLAAAKEEMLNSYGRGQALHLRYYVVYGRKP